MRRLGAYHEAVVLGTCALLVWLALIPGRDHASDHRPLFTAAPTRLTLDGPEREAVVLDLAARPPVLRGPDATIRGRLWPREARAIREALAACRVLTSSPTDALDAERRREYGLDPGTILRVGDEEYLVGSSGLDRGYAIHDDRLLVLDHDLGALLARPAAALRDPSLGLEAPVALGLEDGWRLTREHGRWWLHGADDRKRWTDHTVLELWVDALEQATVTGFLAPPTDALVRARLEVTTAAGSTVTLHDLGPTTDGQRLIRRHQAGAGGGIVEHLITDLDPLFLAPQPQHLRPRTLSPLDPHAAERVVIGELTLTRSGKRWVVDGHADGDQTAIHALLTALASLPASGGSDLGPRLVVERGELRYTREHGGGELADLLRAHPPLQLRHRYLLPDLEPDAVTTLVYQPRSESALHFSRAPGEPWPASERAAAEAFLGVLAGARVERWTGRVDVDAEPDTSHWISIATTDGHHKIHVHRDGRVVIPERQLVGRLTARSRRALGGD